MKFRHHLALAIALLLLSIPSAAAETGGPGVVVEEIGPGSALEKAGLRPGDLLLAWDGEEIRTVFDWLRLKAEQAPRGSVSLSGEREGTAISFEIPKGDWESRVRPRMAADLLATYTEGRRRIAAGDVEGGAALWDGLADLKPWILLAAGAAWSEIGQPEKARAALQAALDESGDAQIRVAALDALGQSYRDASDMVHAEASYRSALETAAAAWGESLQKAAMAAKLGSILRWQDRTAEAEPLLAAALEMRERLAPGSPDVADSLNQLAGLAWTKGELAEFYGLARRALAVQEQWAPDSMAAANILNHVGISALERGLYEEGRMALQRALDIQERHAPGSLKVAMSLANLGVAARATGELELAEELLQRALDIRKRLSPESSGVAVILTNLGVLARERGDLGGPGDLGEAAELFQGSLAIWQKSVPQGLGVATNLNSLGVVARMQGDLDKAWDLHGRALEIREKIAPGSLDSAKSLRDLAQVAEARGDLKTALGLDERALSIWELRAPGSIDEALTLQAMGRLHLRQGRTDRAAQLLARAVDALESQVGRLGGSQEARARYRASHGDIYRDAVEIELERGRAAAAFHMVERSRARSFLALLAERDIAFGDLPEALERSRRDNAARYDRKLRELAQAGEETKETLRHDLDRLRQERQTIAEEILEASPRAAALREPQPLDLEAARKVLDPGTLALSYSVGKDKTALFAVTREGGLQVKTLPIGQERLRREVESFLEKVRSQEEPTPDLYRELIAPVASLMASSERVLILPDGPLHRLPFGALVHNGRFLIEEKPLHTALSLTVYGTLRSSSSATGKLVAFGDPRFPKSMQATQATRKLSPGLRSFDWSTLPYSRTEVERIAGIYPGARVYLGEEATEEHARSIQDARILHFATHGYTDDRTPLDSALVLTIPEELAKGRQNGLLQVWEIFESVRIDADLVVLSACESALGREMSGEGLIGLTRAFQYAGARTVAASLWSVADQVTAELMARFHRHLAAGLPKDQALRAAQLELIREPLTIITASGQPLEMDASAPFFWAAFQLFGDWK
jgi:CHAT domain-containing protein